MPFPTWSYLATGRVSIAVCLLTTWMCDFGSNTTDTPKSGKSEYHRGVVSSPTGSTGYGNIQPMAHSGRDLGLFGHISKKKNGKKK